MTNYVWAVAIVRDFCYTEEKGGVVMKLRYMGTAALERLPALFCNCENCRKAMAAGGRNIMTRSQALVDDKLLIDLNSETYTHFLQMGKTMTLQKPSKRGKNKLRRVTA